MNTETPRKRRWSWRATAVVGALAVVAAGATVATNTNAFGPGDLCDGLLSSGAASDALHGSGRVTASSDSEGSCTVEQSGWLPGTEDAKIRLSATAVTPDHPFGRSEWKASGARNILQGELPGAFDQYGNGWVSLPSDCGPLGTAWAEGDHTVLSVFVDQGNADPEELARLTRSAARKLAADHDCAPTASSPRNAGTDLIEASAPAESDPAEVCGLDGFTLGSEAPAGSPLREQTSGSRDDAWYCDLSLAQPETGLPRDDDREPFVRLAIIRNPELLAAAKKQRFDHAVCGGKATYFATDSATYVFAPDTPQEKAAATLFKASDVTDRFAEAARAALDCD
ncbi:hypothetical protein ACIRJR_04825 [Streptomyces sp. NPDC102402]|uniref:hypothetical protein n=1 Tax=Streptomyces sp. NPDC102402 TaxID=3366169 RepID=UPI0037F7F4D8